MKRNNGIEKLNFIHGETNTPTWKSWSSMFDRCNQKTHPQYKNYGGKGIKVHPDFYDYVAFKSHIGERPSKLHTIDRIDNEIGYQPGNVRWATRKEQATNRKTNIFTIVNGNKVCLSEAARLLKVGKSTISRWVKLGKIKTV
jgi:hypothetical protein